MSKAGAITLERIERDMEKPCRHIAAEEPTYALKCIPIYQRLEREIEARRATSDVLAAARARATSKLEARTTNYAPQGMRA